MDAAIAAPFQLRPAATTDIDAIVDVWFTGWRAAHLGQVPDALLAHRSDETFRHRIPEILGATTVAMPSLPKLLGAVTRHPLASC